MVQEACKSDPPRPSRLDGNAPRPLEAICLKAMSRAPQNRYPEVAALAADVRCWLDDILQARNPGYKGDCKFVVKNGVITEIDLPALFVDLSGLEGLQLEKVRSGRHILAPFRGMPLREATITARGARIDLRYARGMPLRQLILAPYANPFNDLRPLDKIDLSPLRGAPLEVLSLGRHACDLEPLRGMELKSLECWGATISNIEPLRGMPLQQLNLGSTMVQDLRPLKDAPISTLEIGDTPVSNLSPLKGSPLRVLNCGMEGFLDLAPLKGMPLQELDIGGMRVSDLTVLQTMPLKTLFFSPNVIAADLGPLRGCTTLEQVRVNGNQAIKPAEFWDWWEKHGKNVRTEP